MPQLEIACFNAASAVAAARAGADRIELCVDYAAGGVTPSVEEYQRARTAVAETPMNVMIRPRAGDFVYSPADFSRMKLKVDQFKQLGEASASGLVFGILDDQDGVDEARNSELVRHARPLPCTFHRAFDRVPDQREAVERIIRCGFSSILTSGGASSAVLGADRVAELQKEFGHRIKFIVGGGVRSTNVGALQQRTGVDWYHSAAITGDGELVDEEEIKNLLAAL